MYVESDGTGRCGRVARFAFSDARNLKAPAADDSSGAERVAPTQVGMPIRQSAAVGVRSAVAWVACLSIVIVLAIGGSAEAQQVPPPAELRPGISPDRVPPLQPPPVEPDLTTPTEVDPDLPPGAEAARFFLADIVIDGSTVYDDGQLRPLYAEFLQTEISLATLYGIASAIETRYRDDGYIISRAIVPAQSVSDGVYRIQVIEGFVTNVVLEGDVGSSRGLIERYLGNILDSRPVNIADIERYLLLMNDLPGISGTGVLRPSGSDVGAAELVVNAQRKRYDAFALVDNRGSEFTGEEGAALGLSANGFTQFGEQTELVLFSALEDEEQRVGQITYEQQLGSDGLTIRGLASYGDSEPGGTLETLDVEQETLLFTLETEYPYVRSRRFNFSVSAGFDFIEQDSEILGGSSTVADDSLRVLHATATMDYRDSFGGANFAEFGIRQGLPILGASDEGDANLSRVEGDGTFTSLNAEVARLQRLSSNFNLLAQVGGQYGFDDELLSTEEFEVGGLTFGRGYDPSELTGDSGLGTTVELQFNQAPGLSFLQSYQVYAFYDFGVVWNSDTNTPSQASLASAGVGVRTNLTDWLSVDLEVAKPLTREPANRSISDPDAERYFFRVTGQF